MIYRLLVNFDIVFCGMDGSVTLSIYMLLFSILPIFNYCAPEFFLSKDNSIQYQMILTKIRKTDK